MFNRRKLASVPASVAVAPPTAAPAVPRCTAATRRAAETDLFAGIGAATETNRSLGVILRDALGLVDELAAFSGQFETSAEVMRDRADRFVASVSTLQSQSDVIEERLATAAVAVDRAQARSRSALASVADLIGWLRARGEGYEAAFADAGTIRAAIDHAHVKHDASLAGAREIAFFPPMTGG